MAFQKSNKLKRTYTIDEARTAVEAYCAYQERCHSEVRKKLTDLGMIPETHEQIIDRLILDKFLNETRYAQSFARGKFRNKKWGKTRITRELKMKGIKDFTIKKALAEIPDEEYQDEFDALARKRLNQLTETDKYKKRNKLAQYLLYRGWDSPKVFEKVKELIP